MQAIKNIVLQLKKRERQFYFVSFPEEEKAISELEEITKKIFKKDVLLPLAFPPAPGRSVRTLCGDLHCYDCIKNKVRHVSEIKELRTERFVSP